LKIYIASEKLRARKKTHTYDRLAAGPGLGKPRPFVAVPPKRGGEFRFQKLLDEAANAGGRLRRLQIPTIPATAPWAKSGQRFAVAKSKYAESIFWRKEALSFGY
jgi:hypothetical protein